MQASEGLRLRQARFGHERPREQRGEANAIEYIFGKKLFEKRPPLWIIEVCAEALSDQFATCSKCHLGQFDIFELSQNALHSLERGDASAPNNSEVVSLPMDVQLWAPCRDARIKAQARRTIPVRCSWLI